MATFIGDFPCKLDTKGRVALPAALKRQLEKASQACFVVKKDIFDKCLILYPMEEWERQVELVRSRVNAYNKEHSRFMRSFFRGTAELSLDASGRLLLPKRLLEQVDIDKEIYMAGLDGKIEIWAKELYEDMEEDEDVFADLAEKILGDDASGELL